MSASYVVKFSDELIFSVAGNHIPPIPSLLPFRFRFRLRISPSPYTYPRYIANLLSNPYTISPVLFCASTLLASTFLPLYVSLSYIFYMWNALTHIVCTTRHQHRAFDLFLACIETVVTFKLAYQTAVKLGAVLLQTSPSRGLPGGRMEAFLRAMREVRP